MSDSTGTSNVRPQDQPQERGTTKADPMGEMIERTAVLGRGGVLALPAPKTIEADYEVEG